MPNTVQGMVKDAEGTRARAFQELILSLSSRTGTQNAQEDRLTPADSLSYPLVIHRHFSFKPLPLRLGKEAHEGGR